MIRTRIFAGIALVVALAACGETGSDPLGPGDRPSMNGGLVVGGNRGDTTSTGGSGSSTATEPDTTGYENGGLVVGGN